MVNNENIEFNTGNLTKTELKMILDSLPIDITFVDKDDEVKYFNKLEARIFKRSPKVIGLNVRNCHPEKSLYKVTTILDDFRNRKRKVAEFWINLNGQLIYIRYFPVRNMQGDYLGCLEVTQDISELMKLKGEKKLL